MIAVADWFSEMTPVDAVGLIPAGAVLVATVALIAATLPTTWLRLTAVPIALVAVLMISARSLPDVLVSEDGRLVALRTRRRRHRRQPLAPQRLHDGGLAARVEGRRGAEAEDRCRPTNSPGRAEPMRPVSAAPRICASPAAPTGALVVHAANAAAAKPFCETAALIVIDDATAENVCAEGDPSVVTKRDLARRGSASVNFGEVPAKARRPSSPSRSTSLIAPGTRSAPSRVRRAACRPMRGRSVAAG